MDVASRILPWGTRRNARIVLVVMLVVNGIYLAVLFTGLVSPRASPLENRWLTRASTRATLDDIGTLGRETLANSMLVDLLFGVLFAGALTLWLAYALRRLVAAGALVSTSFLALPWIMAGANAFEDLAVVRVLARYPDDPGWWIGVLDVATTIKALALGASLVSLVVLMVSARRREERRAARRKPAA